MTPRKEFHPLQAQEIARAFLEEGVDYLFIGKSGAILPYAPLPTSLAWEAWGQTEKGSPISKSGIVWPCCVRTNMN
jgi:hypothetical protein